MSLFERFALPVVMMIVLIMGYGVPVVAAASLDAGMGAVSFSVAEEDLILSGRFFPADRLAIIAEGGISAISNDDSGADYSIGAGIRKYILVDTNLAPFLGAAITFFSDYLEATDKNEDGVEMNVHFGAEYFFGDRFSVEGSMGIAFETITTGEDHTRFGTARSALGANFYFP
jgi:hypothetical protein